MWANILCFLHLYSDVITAISTALLTIVTGGLVVFAFTQRGDSHRQLRAYVAVGEDEENREIREGFRVKLQPVIANCGATPAFDLSFIGAIEALPASLQHANQLPSIVRSHAPSVGTLFPKGKSYLAVESKTTYTKEDFADFAGFGDRRLYLYGTAFYRDAFKISRWTNFCYEIKMNERGDIHGWHLTPCHNDCN